MTNIDYLYNPDAVKDFFGKNYFVDKKLHFKIIERGTILPHKHMYINGQWTWGFGGIVDEKNNFVKESFVHYGAGEAYTPLERIYRDPNAAVYLGLFYPVWGHAISDNVRRLWFLKSDVFKEYFKDCLWFLKSDVFKEYFKDCPLLYIPWGGRFSLEYQKNFSRLLEILEIDVSRLQPIYHPVQFENVIMPDDSFTSEGFTEEYRELIDRLRNFALKNRTPTSSKKIYYFYGTAQFGEERLAEYFKSKGYEIISPENLTLDEQLNLLINARNFASTLGSCSHNSVFLRDDTKVTLIPRAANRFAEDYQQALDQVHPLKVNYVDSSLSIFEKMNGPYCFIISEQLKKFFGDKFEGYETEDLKTFLTYVKYCVGNGFKSNQRAMAYYDEVHQKLRDQLSQRKDLLEEFGVSLS